MEDVKLVQRQAAALVTCLHLVKNVKVPLSLGLRSHPGALEQQLADLTPDDGLSSPQTHRRRAAPGAAPGAAAA